MVVVSDTSPLTNLLKIGYPELLKDVFGTVLIPEKVFEEILAWKDPDINLSQITEANWLEVRTCSQKQQVEHLKNELDPGEAEAISLALELSADYLLIDERRGYKIAKANGLNVLGLIGVLLKAKDMRITPNVLPLVEALRVKAGFWISEELFQTIREISGE
ncbi:MAG: DUF3368 domain-containing protein [Bacteroidia bacterium]